MKTLIRSKIFWAGLCIRLCLMPFFASTYLTDLFLPFLNHAVLNFGQNPWRSMPPEYFPYGSFLFLLMYVPRQLAYWVFGPITITNTALSLVLCKIPLVASEIVLMRALCRRTSQPSLFMIYFWINPIVIYISYVHGQFDAVVTTCTVLSLVYLIDRRIMLSAITMGCALASKFSAIVAVPMMLAYLWNREFPRKASQQIAKWITLFAIVAVTGFIPVIAAGKFAYTSLASPEAMRMIAAKIELGNGIAFYLGVALLLTVIGRLCVATRITSSGLIYGSGLIFALLVVATNTMPGWYYWTIPFMALLYANQVNAPRFPWYLAHAAYFINFVIVPSLSLPEILSQDQWQSASFTLLQTCFIGIITVMWVVSLREEARLERFVKPLMIGVAGDSAVGKNRLSETLQDLFGAKSTVVVEGDDYHKWERGDHHYERYTHLSPHANNLRVLEFHTRELIEGRVVKHKQYDHSTGQFNKTRTLKGGKTVIVQGLHTLYLRASRGTYDLRIFLDPHELVNLAWKIQRDVIERGYDIRQVMTSLENRRYDANTHIRPQREFADWIIEAVPKHALSRADVIAGIKPDIKFRHILWNDAKIDRLIDALKISLDIDIALEPIPDSVDRIALVIDGSLPAQSVADIASALCNSLRHVTRSTQPPIWRAGHDGLMQLIALNLLDSEHARTADEVGHDNYQTSSKQDRKVGPTGPGMGDRGGRSLEIEPRPDIAAGA